MPDDDTAPPPADDEKVQAPPEPEPEPTDPDPAPEPGAREPGPAPDPAPEPDTAETLAPLQPLAVDDPALHDPAALVRIQCPRDQRCLWAGPAMPDFAQHPDPATEVRAAAGCLADPPTCPCATGAADQTQEAVTVVATGPPLPTPIRARPGGGIGPAGFTGEPGGLVPAAVFGAAAPQELLTAEAHGLVGNGRLVPTPMAFGDAEVSGVLQALGYSRAAIEEAMTGRVERGDAAGPAAAGEPGA